MDVDALLSGEAGGPHIPRDCTLFGNLFESLVTLSVRVYAQAAEANVRHLRTHDGRHEVDLIVERADQRVLAIETKLSASVGDADVKHLLWLKGHLGNGVLDAVIVTTGTQAYRRPDGVAVVPARACPQPRPTARWRELLSRAIFPALPCPRPDHSTTRIQRSEPVRSRCSSPSPSGAGVVRACPSSQRRDNHQGPRESGGFSFPSLS